LDQRSRRAPGGKGDKPFEAQEHGEHAHTRDVVRLETQRILDRLDRSDQARGMVRQSDQIGISAERMEESAVKRALNKVAPKGRTGK
jgi:hypothetical protein